MIDTELAKKHTSVNILSWNLNNAEVAKYHVISKAFDDWDAHIVLIQEFGEWQGGDKVDQWEACLHKFEWHWNLQDITDVWEEKIVEEYAETWVQNRDEVFQQVKKNTSVLGRGMAIGVRKDLNAIVQRKAKVNRRAFGIVLGVSNKRLEIWNVYQESGRRVGVQQRQVNVIASINEKIMDKRVPIVIGGDWNWVIRNEQEWLGTKSAPTNKELKNLLKTLGMVDIMAMQNPDDNRKTRAGISRLDKWVTRKSNLEVFLSTDIKWHKRYRITTQLRSCGKSNGKKPNTKLRINKRRWSPR
jgi:exonuclease III